MHVRRLPLALALIVVTAAETGAQPDPTPDPDRVPAGADAAPPAPAPIEPAAGPPPADDPPAPRFTWQPFGYLRIQAAVVQNDPNVAFVGRSDGFELQNARLGARGALGTRADVVISFDGAVDERDRINDPNGRLRVGLRDAYADLHAGAVDLRVGRFDVVFDPERILSDTERAFVDRALPSRGVRPTEGWEAGGLPPGRSIGVALRRDPGAAPGSGPGFGFEVAAQNGADEFSSDNDNDLPAISAAAMVELPGAAIVAAVRWNARTEGDLPFRQDETDLQAALGAVIAAGPVQLAGGGVFVHTIYDTTGGPAQNAWGAHAQAMVRVVPGRMPVRVGYRFAIIDPSDLILTDRVMEHTAGAVIAWPAWRMRAQLNVTHVIEQAARDLSNDRVEAALEVQL